MTRSRRPALVVALILCIGATTVHTGCIGSFALTRAMYKFNKGISGNKIVQWIVFLFMIVLPIYWFGLVVDGLILNSLEFWFGSNPLAAKTTGAPDERVVELDDGSRLRLVRWDAQRMGVTLQRGGDVELDVMLEIDDQAAKLYDGEGRLVAMASDGADGGLRVTGARGQTLWALDADSRTAIARSGELPQLMAAVRRELGAQPGYMLSVAPSRTSQASDAAVAKR